MVQAIDGLCQAMSEEITLIKAERNDSSGVPQEWTISVFGRSVFDPLAKEAIVFARASSMDEITAAIATLLSKNRIAMDTHFMSRRDGYILASARAI